MNFANVVSLAIPEGNVVRIESSSVVLWRKGSAPTPPVGGYQLLYLQNGDSTSNTKQRGWSIDTGITWRDVFASASGLSSPGLETEITYMYSTVPPEGGMFAGAHPRYNQAGGGGSRDMGGFWRIFGHGGANFCFDCPSEDDRVSVSGNMVAGRLYTEYAKYGYLNIGGATEAMRSYLKVEYEDNGSTVVQGESSIVSSYSWTQANLPHNLYLWSDNSQTSGDTAPRGGVRIYKFTVYRLESGVRVQKLYEGLPWMDENNVPCIKDTVSDTLQYNCASGGAAFLYGEIS